MGTCKTIIQGTTPTHTFTLPPELSAIKRARFVYSQRGEVVVIRDSADGEVEINEGEATATLTQEDTFKLEPGASIELVLRVLTEDGVALTADPVLLVCRESKDKEVLV